MRRSNAAALVALVALAGGLAFATHARADVAPPSAPVASAAASTSVVEITPVFSSLSTGVRYAPPGWTEMVVRVQNKDAKPLSGEVRITDREWSRESREFVVSAPFTAPAKGAVVLRLPVEVPADSSVFVTVVDDHAAPLGSTTFAPSRVSTATLVDVGEPSRVRESVGDLSVVTRYQPPISGGRVASAASLAVVSPRFDPATGDPILPDRAAAYTSADAVLLRSDVLVRLAGDELDALSRYVLGGGTLAVVLARPEDVRHPTMTAFAGGAITKGSVSAVTLNEPTPSVAVTTSGTRPVPWARNPGDDTLRALVGFTGGNLHGSVYGNSAAYGAGEVHLLAFDPSQKPGMNDPWVQARLVDLARRAYDRRATQILRAETFLWSRDTSNVRKQLDPNEGSHWVIAAAALLLCIYALLAGPYNFSRASRAGKPLRALWRLPIYSAVAFAAIVGIGLANKGVRGRARHLTFVEAGAGMSAGWARRYRGFYTARSEKLTIRTSDRGSVIRTLSTDARATRMEQLLVDRDGARLVDVAALPWQTLVVKEDGVADLGGGVTLARDGVDDVTVANHTGHALRGVLLHTLKRKTFYAASLADGGVTSSKKMKALDADPDLTKWLAVVTTGSPFASVQTHALHAEGLDKVFGSDAPGLADAWRAIETVAGAGAEWFPDGAPVLLAQIDGGEGRRSDSSLVIESDRVLVHVVGFGGAP